MQQRLTTSLLTIVLGALLVLPLMLIALVVLLDMHVPNLTTDLLWTSTVMFVGSCAAGRVLAGRLVRWAWRE